MAKTPKTYTNREEIFNTWSHLVGVFFALAGAVPLYSLACNRNEMIFTAGLIFYWLSFLAMFGASSCYHLCKDQQKKSVIRKLDHSAIYLLITGTYAPLITGVVRNRAGYIILGILITLTTIGIAGKFLFSNRFHFLEVIIYLAMGWACVFIAGDLLSTMSGTGLLWLLTGGIAYTAGVVFYVIRREFFHGLWHLFVLAGAIFQFFAILTIK